MGFWKGIKELSEHSKRNKAKREARKKQVNENPTEEQLKNNKKGKLSYLWTFLSVVTYLLAFVLVAGAFNENFAVGIFALLLVLPLSPMVQKKAIALAREQREINGKGLFALILATILPALILCAGILFFVLGYYHMLFM